jgi:drug/metabolite transporter (DMT)-like permease
MARQPPATRPARAAHWRGYALALAAILIWSFWPVWTRHGVTRSLTPEDIVLLRFGIGGALFLPILALQARSIAPRAWIAGLGLALCQGAPFVLLMAIGLRFAPAAHAASLTTGTAPLFAALLGALLLAEPIARGRWLGLALILVGAGALAAVDSGPSVALGDLLFLAAAAMASIYIVFVPRARLTPVQAAALVSVYSLLIVVPAYLLIGGGRLAEAETAEIVLQGIYQGGLMAFASFILLNSAIKLLGSARASAVIALVPVFSLAFAIPLLGEWPTPIEALSAGIIATGVYLAAQGSRADRPRAVQHVT